MTQPNPRAIDSSPHHSLHRNALRQVARLVDVAAELDGEMVGEELQGNHGQDGADVIGDGWDGDDVVGDLGEVIGAFAGGNGNDGAFPGANLLDVVQVLGKNGVVRGDEDGREIRPDEGDDAVLQLGARVAFGKKVGDLFQF